MSEIFTKSQNIVESGVKHHNPIKITQLKLQHVSEKLKRV